MDSTYQTTYLEAVFSKAQTEKDSALMGMAAFQLHQNFKKSVLENAKSLEWITLSIVCFKAAGDSLNYYNSRTGLVSYYFNVKRYDEIVRILKKNIDYYHLSGNQFMQVHASVSIARAYYGMGKKKKAQDCYNTALELNKIVKDTIIDLIALKSTAQIHQDDGEYEQAIIAAKESLRLSELIGNFNWKINSLFYLGMNHQFNGDFDKAIGYFQEIVNTNRGIVFLKVKEQSFKHLSQCYEDRGNYKKAYLYACQYAALVDRISQKQKAEDLDKLTLAFESKEKQIAIDLLEKENEFVKNTNKQKSQILYGLTSVLFVLFILFWLLVRFYRDKTRKDEIIANQVKRLNQQKIKNLENDLQLTVVKAMLDGQEKERSRIALDLHDSLGGLLSTIKLKLVQGENKENTALGVLLDNAADEVRSIAQDLQPNALQELGLIRAIKDLVNSKNKEEQHLIINFQYYNMIGELPSSDALQLYRIIQESLNNALKHAQASEILVQINGEKKGLSVIIEDDGIGFDTNGIKKGQGLNNLHKRAEFLQAELAIESSNKGTSVYFFLPLNT